MTAWKQGLRGLRPRDWRREGWNRRPISDFQSLRFSVCGTWERRALACSLPVLPARLVGGPLGACARREERRGGWRSCHGRGGRGLTVTQPSNVAKGTLSFCVRPVESVPGIIKYPLNCGSRHLKICCLIRLPTKCFFGSIDSFAQCETFVTVGESAWHWPLRKKS